MAKVPTLILCVQAVKRHPPSWLAAQVADIILPPSPACAGLVFDGRRGRVSIVVLSEGEVVMVVKHTAQKVRYQSGPRLDAIHQFGRSVTG